MHSLVSMKQGLFNENALKISRSHQACC